jgi:hypothetical protein
MDLYMLAIKVESEYRYVSRSLSVWGPKWEPNAPIVTESEVADLLSLLKLIWRPDSSMITIAAGSEVANFCYGWRYHAASFGLVVSCWLGISFFWGGDTLLVDHSMHTGSGAWALICPAGLPLRLDCAEVLTEVEYGLMKRSRILSS